MKSLLKRPSNPFTGSHGLMAAAGIVSIVSGAFIWQLSAKAAVLSVQPAIETQTFAGSGDIADDSAIWVNPADSAKSLVVADNKADSGGGLGIFDLTGKLVSFKADGKIGNVDLRDNFTLGGQPITIVGANRRDNSSLVFYKLDPASQTLTSVNARTINTMSSNYGFCFYKTPTALYANVMSQSGAFQQWELFETAGKVDAKLVRTFAIGSISEGCVADDELGHLYINQEDVGVWKYSAAPTGGSTRTSIAKVGDGKVVADVEGIAIAKGPNDTGHIIVSSQGNDTFVVYDRVSNAYVKTFSVGSNGTIDSVQHTDGIDVTTANLGGAFTGGLLVVHDQNNTGSSTSNLKFVPLAQVFSDEATPAPTVAPTTTVTPGQTAGSISVAAVGDMNGVNTTSTTSNSGKNAASISAALNSGEVSAFLGLGDFQYDQGTCANLVNYWNKLWGAVLPKTYWVTGPNHDWEPGRNADLDDFMNGQCAGSTTKSAINTQRGFIENGEPYSYDLGNWHFAALSTALWRYDTARANAATTWLDNDLAAAKAAGKHLAVIYHDPYFTSTTSSHTRLSAAKPWIDVMYKHRVKLTLSGSQHNYERSCPVNNADQCVPDGMTAFNVSTGGVGLRSFTSTPSYITKRFSDSYGWLKLTLNADGSFAWDYKRTSSTGTGADTGTQAASGTSSPAPSTSPSSAPTPTATAVPTATPAGTVTSSLTFRPVADTKVRSDAPSTNYGASTTLEADGSPAARSFMKFSVTGVAGKTVDKVKLRLYNVNASNHGGNIHRVANTAWSESAMTWSNAPAADTSPLASFPAVSTGRWYEIELPGLITQDGTYSLSLEAVSTDGADYRSKEYSGYAPVLTVTVY